MPTISIFSGVVIKMFYNEHEPLHFHAEHQGRRGKFDLSGRVLAGNIRSKTARRLIEEWANKNQVEIEDNWRRVQTGKPLEIIPPLR